jgi:hypothetical protein
MRSVSSTQCDQNSVQVGDHEDSQGQTCVNTPILDILRLLVTDHLRRVAARHDLLRITGHRSREAPPQTAEVAADLVFLLDRSAIWACCRRDLRS